MSEDGAYSKRGDENGQLMRIQTVRCAGNRWEGPVAD
jgi:hypothetical protein